MEERAQAREQPQSEERYRHESAELDGFTTAGARDRSQRGSDAILPQVWWRTSRTRSGRAFAVVGSQHMLLLAAEPVVVDGPAQLTLQRIGWHESMAIIQPCCFPGASLCGRHPAGAHAAVRGATIRSHPSLSAGRSQPMTRRLTLRPPTPPYCRASTPASSDRRVIKRRRRIGVRGRARIGVRHSRDRRAGRRDRRQPRRSLARNTTSAAPNRRSRAFDASLAVSDGRFDADRIPILSFNARRTDARVSGGA